MNGTACKWCGRDYSGTAATCPYCGDGRQSYTLETRDPQAVVMIGNLSARIAALEMWKARMVELIDRAERDHNAEWCECPWCEVIAFAKGGK